MNTSESPQKRSGLSGSTLKLIAIVCMLIDHIGAVIVERHYLTLRLAVSGHAAAEALQTADIILRGIGRIAFPLFCFLLVQGYLHTRSKPKYLRNLGLFSLISEVPFDLAFRGTLFDASYQNVFFTLAIGLAVIWILDMLRQSELPIPAKYLLYPVAVCIGCALAYVCHTDYSFWGILTIVVFYLLRFQKVYAAFFACLILNVMNGNELPALLCIPLIGLYNNRRGLKLKYFFYLFYPVHLLLLWGVYRLFFT